MGEAAAAVCRAEDGCQLHASLWRHRLNELISSLIDIQRLVDGPDGWDWIGCYPDVSGRLSHRNLRGFERAKGQGVEDALQRADGTGFVKHFVNRFAGSYVRDEGYVGRRVRSPAEVDRDVGKGERGAWNAVRPAVTFSWKRRQDLVGWTRKALAGASGSAERVAKSLQVVKFFASGGNCRRRASTRRKAEARTCLTREVCVG